MMQTWAQLERRSGIKINLITFPVPSTQDELFRRFEQAITPRTKLLHFCHITNLSGQLFPVQRLSRMARERGILTMVDGAHAFAHFPFKLADLECDYYGTRLHKRLLAPHGTGFLYVRRDRIASTSRRIRACGSTRASSPDRRGGWHSWGSTAFPPRGSRRSSSTTTGSSSTPSRAGTIRAYA